MIHLTLVIYLRRFQDWKNRYCRVKEKLYREWWQTETLDALSDQTYRARTKLSKGTTHRKCYVVKEV